MPVHPDVSVVVRSLDAARTIESTLLALRSQVHPVEIVVVDSGSTDGTLEVARRWADEVVHLRREQFTPGRALNLGAAAGSGEVLFALSSHCVPATTSWVSDHLEFYRDERVAAVCQGVRTPRGELIEDSYLQTAEDAKEHPSWGFSNHASSWRVAEWRSLPFREDLAACEDKEWSWRVLASGSRIAYSPRVFVPTAHRRGQGPVALYRRVAREAEAMVGLGAVRPPTAAELLRAWWSTFTVDSSHPVPLRRLSHQRVVELAGVWSGGRAAARSRATGQGPRPESPSLPVYLPWDDGALLRGR